MAIAFTIIDCIENSPQMDLWRPSGLWLDAHDVQIMRVSLAHHLKLANECRNTFPLFRVPFPRARTTYKSSDNDNQEADFDLTSTSIFIIGRCMSMNRDCQTATESESTKMWRWTQKSKACMIFAGGNVNLGKDGHAEDTLLHHKVTSQSFRRDVV